MILNIGGLHVVVETEAAEPLTNHQSHHPKKMPDSFYESESAWIAPLVFFGTVLVEVIIAQGFHMNTTITLNVMGNMGDIGMAKVSRAHEEK